MLSALNLLLDRRQNPRKNQRLASLFDAQIPVAGTHCQPVRLADNRAHIQLHAKLQIAHHLAQDRNLRGVFLPEKSTLRSEYIEQLSYHSSHSAEVAGARCA